MTNAQPDEQRARVAFDAGDYRESARLFERLAAQGSQDALVHLGWMYKTGRIGAAPDVEKAISHWEKAAHDGNLSAKYYLARTWMERGEPRRARTLFLESAEQGHPPSMYWAGTMLVAGEGGAVDHIAGAAWLAHAADRGHVFARRDLLALEIRTAKSLPARLRLYAMLAWHIMVSLPVIIRHPDSDSFR